jgi:hypothetical protein
VQNTVLHVNCTIYRVEFEMSDVDE